MREAPNETHSKCTEEPAVRKNSIVKQVVTKPRHRKPRQRGRRRDLSGSGEPVVGLDLGDKRRLKRIAWIQEWMEIAEFGCALAADDRSHRV